MNSQFNEEEAIEARRRQRIAEARRRKRRQRRIRRLIRKLTPLVAGVIILIFLITSAVGKLIHRPHGETAGKKAGTEEASPVGTDGIRSRTEETEEEYLEKLRRGIEETGADSDRGQAGGEDGFAGDDAGTRKESYTAESTEDTVRLGEDIVSSHAILIDVDSDSILAQKDARSTINPASMTKVLTVLVAAEHVKDLDDTVTITRDITDYCYVNDCSNVGFAENETVTIRDLFYGTILPSGADAAEALAIYVAGTAEAFVDMMNAKLDELGLSGTAHFTNCVGVYDKNHYCTVYDMAMILEAAVNNELCKEVLSAHTYTTSETEEHPEGITISNWFLRRIEDKDTGAQVLCGKTGYVLQSGNCAASFGVDGSGKSYVCVTADASSGWRCIYDHVALYKKFSAAS